MGYRFICRVLLCLLIARCDAAIDGSTMALSEARTSSFSSTLDSLRYLRTGGLAPSSPPHKEKKPKTNSKKSKITKKQSMGMMKPSGKGNGPKNPKTESVKQGKGMKHKTSSAPFASETDAPVPPIATTSPVVAPTSVPIAAPTSAPMAATEAPVTLSPTEPPVPDNVVFIDSGNILVSYNSSLNASQFDPETKLELGQILAAVNLTCAYIQTQAIDALGALEFACLWFLTDDNDSSMFPIQIVYSGTAPFYTNTTVIAADMDDAIVNAFDPPQVDSLISSLMTDLNMTNPFSWTTSISAEKLFGSSNSTI